MRGITLTFKFLLFILLFSIPFTGCALIFNSHRFAFLFLILTPLFIFMDHLRSFKIIKKQLDSSKITIFSEDFQTFNGGELSLLVSQHFFNPKPTLWLHASLMEKLSQEELKLLLRKIKCSIFKLESLFETYLTLWILRFSKLTTKKFPIFSIFCYGFIFFFSKFLNKNYIYSSDNNEELNLIQKLQTLKINHHKIPLALQNLSILSFDETELFHYGRSCLWKKEELKRY